MNNTILLSILSLCIGYIVSSISHADSAITLIGVGSCAKQDRPQPLLDKASSRKPDVFVYLGDNIYGDTENMEELKAKYETLGAKPEYQHLNDSTRIIATWDDHDYGANDSGREYPKKEESKEIFLDFFNEPADSLRRTHPGVYTVYEFGPKRKRVQIILLDLRTFRSRLIRSRTKPDIPHAGPYLPRGSNKAILMGEEQWSWLEQKLKRPAKLRLIGSSVQFAAEFHGWESWANFPKERERFIKLIIDTQAEGVILMSGDMHYGELSKMTKDVPYPLYDFTSSGINQEWKHPMQNIHRLGETEFREHIGWIEIDWKRKNTTVRMSLETHDGLSHVNHTVELRELKTSQKR